MSPIVADASVAIRGDIRGYASDLKSAERQTQGFAGRIKNLLTPKGLIGAGALFGLGTTVPGLIRDTIGQLGAAADEYRGLEQAVRTVDSVFGESAGVIEDWAERAASAAGLSKREVNESAALMGQTLSNMGFDADEAADKVVELQQRAADLALSFPAAGGPQDALMAMSSALRGERDTIEKFGVTLTQAMIDAEIAALGLSTATPEAERYAAAIATLNLVMDQSKDSADRFADAQGTTAAELPEAQAKIDNFKAGIGQAVDSIILGAVKVGEATGDIFSNVGMFFDNMFSPEKNAQVEMLADVTGRSFSEMSEEIQRGANEAGVAWEDQLDFMVSATENSASEMEGTSKRIPDRVARGFEAGEPVVRDAVEFGISDPVFDAMLAAEENAGKSGHQVVIEYAMGLLKPQTDVQTAIDAALQVVDDEMSKTEEYAYLSGQKVVLEEARGIAEQEGKQAAILAIDGALSLIQERMDALAENAYISGQNLVASYVGGMYLGMPAISDAAYDLANAASGQIRIESEPPDHSSPLYGITKWGGNLVKTLAESMVGELGTARAASAALGGALSPSFGGAMPAAAGLGGGGATSNYNLIVDGMPIQVGSRQDVLDGWDRLRRGGGG